MNWYVLQVLTGREREVAKALDALDIETMTAVENRMIRSHGKWQQREYVLFPGYVFFQADLTDELYHRLKETGGVIRILSSGGVPSPLTRAEERRVRWLNENLSHPSIVTLLAEGGYCVESGVLASPAFRIVKLDRHRRRARVRFTLGGQPVEINFSVVCKEP